MKATRKNHRGLKASATDTSKTVEMRSNDSHLKGAGHSALTSQFFSQTIQEFKTWNNETFSMWLGEKKPQTDLGDQFIF